MGWDKDLRQTLIPFFVKNHNNFATISTIDGGKIIHVSIAKWNNNTTRAVNSGQ
jgi:hypothetical protein